MPRSASRRPTRFSQRSRRDAGNMMALEAVVVAMLLMTSIVVVVSMDTPSPGVRVTRAPFERLVGDLLEGLHDAPTSDAYQTQLERAIGQAVLGNTSGFTRVVDRTMPGGAECRLWLDNGHQRRLVSGPSERLARESVSNSELWRPTWAYSFVVPSLDVISPTQPLDLQGYAVAQGSLVKEHGVPLSVRVQTSQGTYDRAAITSIRDAPTASLYMLNEAAAASFSFHDALLSSTNTTVHTATGGSSLPTPGTFNVSAGVSYLDVRSVFSGTLVDHRMTFTSPTNVPYVLPAEGAGTVHANLTILDGTPGTWTFSGSGSVTGRTPSSNLTVKAYTVATASDFTFVVKEEAGKPVPIGTSLTLRFPATFTEVEGTNLTQAGWRNIRANLSLTEGFEVSAELDSPLTSAARNLVVHARRPTIGDALYPVHAELGNGTWGRSTFALGQAVGTTSTYNEIQRGVALSVPKPMAPGSTSTWGVLVAYPATVSGLAETVTQVDLRAPGGQGIFDAVADAGGPGAWARVDAAHLRWTGAASLGANQALSIPLRVTANLSRTPDEPSQRVPVDFADGTRFDLADLARPHVGAASIPPPTDAGGNPRAGYHAPASSGIPPKADSTLGVDWVIRGVAARGNATYTVSPFVPIASAQEALRLGLARSSLTLSSQQVKVGDAVTVQVDLQGLLDQVTALGASASGWTVELSVYDPAQPFAAERAQMKPSYQGRYGSAGGTLITSSGSALPNIASWQPTNATATSPARANFTFVPPRDSFYGPHAILAQASFTLTDGLGGSIVQTARMLGLVEVVPDSGQAETSLYWAVLECWLPDW